MIDLQQLVDSYAWRHSKETIPGPGDFNDARRQLYAIAHKCNRPLAELKQMKELAGPDKTFRFLDLPPETRNPIYIIALQAKGHVDIGTDAEYNSGDKENTNKPPTPGLLRANRQIYKEAIKLLYSENVFKFYSPKDLLEVQARVH